MLSCGRGGRQRRRFEGKLARVRPGSRERENGEAEGKQSRGERESGGERALGRPYPRRGFVSWKGTSSARRATALPGSLQPEARKTTGENFPRPPLHFYLPLLSGPFHFFIFSDLKTAVKPIFRVSNELEKFDINCSGKLRRFRS